MSSKNQLWRKLNELQYQTNVQEEKVRFEMDESDFDYEQERLYLDSLYGQLEEAQKAYDDACENGD